MTDRPIRELYIIGGGSRNALLCRLAARAASIPVYAGPAEATAIGNILVQSLATGHLDSIAEGRRHIRESYQIRQNLP